MTDTPTVHVAMGRVLAALPAIGKLQRNQQQGFNFRGIDDVLNALNPLLSEHGVVIVPHRVLERVADKRQTKSGSVMFEVNLRVQYRIYGPAGDYIEAEGWGEGTDSGDKATPKAMTGAYKYVLFQAFAINTEEASKNEADRHSPEPSVHLIDCPEACGLTHTKDAMRGHLLDAHGWIQHDDGRVSRPPSPAPVPPPPPADNGPTGSTGAGPPAPLGTREEAAAEGAHPPAAASPGLRSDKQNGMLLALCAQAGKGERQDRLDWASDTLGRFVESFSTLTKREASQLIDVLNGKAEGVGS